jgi:NADPH:quinone reductase-like Zn-dependent oxidoreductase
VGVVEELGAGTSGRLSRGQRVVAANWGQAAYQEYVAIDEKDLVPRILPCASFCCRYIHSAAYMNTPARPPQGADSWPALCRRRRCLMT